MFRGGAVPIAAFAAIVLGILSPAIAAAQNQPIGAFTPEPVNQNVGPQQAKGLIVYSHGYTSGLDHTQSPTQPYVKDWSAHGYDAYRFNRRYILDPSVDAKSLVDSVRAARALGYKRVILTGQSTGAWESIMAAGQGVQADGIIAMSPAWHGKIKDQKDLTRTKSEWNTYVKAIPPGARYFIAKFLDDEYDVGGTLEATRSVFAQHGVDAVLLNYPAGFSGHHAADKNNFNKVYGPCMFKFIETGVKEPPCVGI